MFKKLTLEDKLKAERAEKMEMLKKQADIEAALLDLAQIVSDTVTEAQNGETVL